MVKWFRKKHEPQGAPAGGDAGVLRKFREGLAKTRSTLTGPLDRLFLGKKEITEDILEELEEILYSADMGVSTTQELIQLIQEKVNRKELNDPKALKSLLKEAILGYVNIPPADLPEPNVGEPRVIMVVGVNGVGKTTAIGKAAHRFTENGKSVILVAADTFRAAAAEQLTVWGERTGSRVIQQQSGADPSAVVFDALTAASSGGADVVLVDTAGRLHTKTNLMEELQKIRRVAGRNQSGAPHEVWLVLDATTGQNAVSQAKIFNEALGVTGVILTKLDGTAKGGVAVSITHQMSLPILYIGIGEKVEDLRPFDPEAFVEALFD